MAYRILIVDDDIELLKMLKNYFEIKRYDVMMAEDGTDALEKIHKKPDIILDRKSTRLNSSHDRQSRMPSSA